MLVRIFLFLSVCSVINAFNNCSQTDFCSRLRGFVPDDDTKLVPNIGQFEMSQGGIFVDCSNNNGKSVTLQIYALLDDKFRFKFVENDNERYELQDVLAEEPELLQINTFEMAVNQSKASLSTGENSTAKIVINKEPFEISLYQNDVLELTIDASRLYFDSIKDSQAFIINVKFPDAQKLYGLHEHAEHLALKATGPNSYDPYRFMNADSPAYQVYGTGQTYGAIPVVYGHNPDVTSGIFLHNAAQQWIDISYEDDGASALFIVEGGSVDLFALPGPSFKEVVRQYTNLTGTAHMPQMWALGYHQCRNSYMTQEEVKEVVAQMDSHDFPMDTIWLDIDYTNGKRYFTWNPDTFSDPEEMQRNISSTNRKLITIIDPHYMVDEAYPVYTGGKDQGLFVKNADGSDFQGTCWPGLSSWFDFLNPKARDFYASQYSYENFPHSTETLAGIWNDMNEPSVFDMPDSENTMPSDCVHIGNVKHRDVHNIYGFLHTMGTHQGLMERDNNTKRPFILTRSTFAGSQRYSAFWLGDNMADWPYLSITIPMCLNANLLGLVFCGSDIGGFIGVPTEELLVRWYQASSWLPFFREHSTGDQHREPYLYNDTIQSFIRQSIKDRYKHLPVWYTLFYEHTRTGDPVIRPLIYEDNSADMEEDNSFLLGSNILVVPITAPGVNSMEVQWPGKETLWYHLNSGRFYDGLQRYTVPIGLDSIVVTYKEGSIIVRKDVERASSEDMKNDPFTLYLTLKGENGKASGTLYVDDLVSFEYKNNADFIYLNIEFDGHNLLLTQVDGVATTNKYPIVISNVIINGIKDGSSFTKNITQTTDGTKLKDVKIDTKQPFTIKIQ